MNDLINQLNNLAFQIAPIFYKVLFMSISAMCIGLTVLIIRKLMDQKISPIWKYILWAVMLIALLIPFRPQSPWGVLKGVAKIEDTSYRAEYNEIKYRTKIANQRDMDIQEDSEIEKQQQIENSEIKQINQQSKSIYMKSLVFDVIIPLLWLIGSILAFLILIFSKISLMIQIGKSARNYELSNPEEYRNTKQRVAGILAKCQADLRINNSMEIILQDYISSPAITGILQGKILLPAYVNQISDQSLSYILYHELGHYKRRDMLINYLILGLQVIYWFNPVILILFKYIREDMELSNDSYVLSHIGEEHSKKYASSLVEVLGNMNHIQLVPKLLCMVDDKQNMQRRIKMIQLREQFKQRKIWIGLGSILLIVVISILFLTGNSELEKYSKNPPKAIEADINGEMKKIDLDTELAKKVEKILDYQSWQPDQSGKFNQLKIATLETIHYGENKWIWVYPDIDGKLYFSVGKEKGELYWADSKIWREVKSLLKESLALENENKSKTSNPEKAEKESSSSDSKNQQSESTVGQVKAKAEMDQIRKDMREAVESLYEKVNGKDEIAISKAISNYILKEMIEEDYDDKAYNNADGWVPLIDVDLIQINQNQDEIQAYVYVFNGLYTIENRIFDNIYGSYSPARYDLNRQLEIKNVVIPEDGNRFYSSMLEMANNDQDLVDKLMPYNNKYKENYDRRMAKLKENAIKMGLPKVSYAMDEIPGYEQDVVVIENDRYSKDTVAVIKREDYESLLAERKEIVPSDQPGKHWVYRHCVYYHKNLGITTKGILEYSDSGYNTYSEMISEKQDKYNPEKQGNNQTIKRKLYQLYKQVEDADSPEIIMKKKIYNHILEQQLERIYDGEKYYQTLKDYQTLEAIPVIFFDTVKVNNLKNKTEVYINLADSIYSLKNGIFIYELGGIYPARYDFDANLGIIKQTVAEDGKNFYSSILKMAHGDEGLAKKLWESQTGYMVSYDQQIAELKNNALKLGLKNISHTLDTIPGYENDVNYEKEGEWVKITDKYSSNQGKYRDPVKFNEKLGVAVYD